MTRTVRGSRKALFLIAPLMLTVSTGCPKPDEPKPEPPKIEPRTNDEIVSTLSENARKLDRALWSTSVQVVAHIVDEDKEDHTYNLEGSLLYQKPRNLLIKLRPGVGGEVMQVGSNRDEYWAWIEPELARMWWGRHEHANKPCAQRVLVRPDELVAAMGIGLPDSDELIGPVRRHGKTVDILQYSRRTSSGSIDLVQEYWVEREPPYLVRLVAFFDEYGRKAMTASLDEYEAAFEGGPLVAHKISIIWPIEGSKLSLAVRNYKSVDESKLKDSAFARPITSPPLPASVAQHVYQIDADCDGFGIREPFFNDPVVPASNYETDDSSYNDASYEEGWHDDADLNTDGSTIEESNES